MPLLREVANLSTRLLALQPGERGSFDAAHCDRVLMHLEDPSAALAEMRRVVIPGGRIVAASLVSGASSTAEWRMSAWWTDESRWCQSSPWTAQTLIDALAAASRDKTYCSFGSYVVARGSVPPAVAKPAHEYRDGGSTPKLRVYYA